MSTPTQPKPKRHRFRKALVITAVILVLLIGCSALMSGGGDPAPTPAPETSETTAPPTAAPEPAPTTQEQVGDIITMTATSTSPGESTVSWYDADGSMNSEPFVGTWTKDIPIEPGELYNMTVTGDFMDPNPTVTCELSVNGEVKDTASGSGQIGSASCNQPIFG